jgi:hypothetical protein
MNAAYAGDLAAFREIITRTPALVSARSSCSHPTLLQFVAVDGDLGKIPRPAGFAQVLIVAGAALDEPLVAAASVNAREVLDAILTAGASAPWTALEEALYWGYSELATYLWRERGADVSVVDGRFNVTVAGWARYFGHDKLAEHIEAKAV